MMNKASDNIDYDGETWLYPCPFCGGKAEYIEVGNILNHYSPDYYIRCTKCQLETFASYKSKGLARKYWNRRVKI